MVELVKETLTEEQTLRGETIDESRGSRGETPSALEKARGHDETVSKYCGVVNSRVQKKGKSGPRLLGGSGSRTLYSFTQRMV